MPVPPALSAVPFVYGCFEADRLPGTLVVESLADLGVTASATRTALHRLVRRGALEVHRAGRLASYGMTTTYRSHFLRIRDGERPDRWRGAYDAILYDVPESLRRIRDELRQAAFARRYGAPRPGVLLTPARDAPLVEPAWLPPHREAMSGDAGAWVAVTRLSCALPQARELAERGWGLSELADQLRRHAEWLESVEHEVRSGGPAADPLGAYRLLADVFCTPSPTQLRDPGLPPELLPHDWPAHRLWTARDRVCAALDDPVRAYLTARATRCGFPELVPPADSPASPSAALDPSSASVQSRTPAVTE